jgi:hypothetical protein
MRVEEECCWAITQQRDGHTAADQVPVCWGLDFSWTTLSVPISSTIIFHQLGISRNWTFAGPSGKLLLRVSGCDCNDEHYSKFYPVQRVQDWRTTRILDRMCSVQRFEFAQFKYFITTHRSFIMTIGQVHMKLCEFVTL